MNKTTALKLVDQVSPGAFVPKDFKTFTEKYNIPHQSSPTPTYWSPSAFKPKSAQLDCFDADNLKPLYFGFYQPSVGFNKAVHDINCTPGFFLWRQLYLVPSEDVTFLNYI